MQESFLRAKCPRCKDGHGRLDVNGWHKRDFSHDLVHFILNNAYRVDLEVLHAEIRDDSDCIFSFVGNICQSTFEMDEMLFSVLLNGWSPPQQYPRAA